jgi:hypothetical protein
MKTYEIRLKPYVQRATDVERYQFTQEIPYGSACERCLGRVLVIGHACRKIVLLKS